MSMHPNATIDTNVDGYIGHHAGPFLSSNGDLYHLDGEVDVPTAGDQSVYMFKAAGSDITSWTEQDGSNRPVLSGPTNYRVKGCGVWQEGDVLHIIQVDHDNGAGDFWYHTFNMATDAWVVVSESVVTGHSSDSSTPGICVRDNGDVIICYNSNTDKIKGIDYGRVDYARRVSGTWTTDIALDAAGENTYHSARLAPGGLSSSTTVHFTWMRGTGVDVGTSSFPPDMTDVQARTLRESGNTLSTIVTTSSNIQDDEWRTGQGITVWDDGGTERAYWCVAQDAFASFHLRATFSSGDILAPTEVQDSGLNVQFTDDGNAVAPDLASWYLDGVVYLFYTDITTDSLMVRESRDNGASFSPPIPVRKDSEAPAGGHNHLSSNLYVRNGRPMIGNVFLNALVNANAVFNEYELDTRHLPRYRDRANTLLRM